MGEIALISARKTKLESLANKGDEKAKTALSLINNPERFLSTAQIGMTLIAILTGVYSGEKFGKQYVEQIAERARKGEHKLLLQVGAKAQDMELKNYATKTLAVIESQQQLVKDTSRSIESGSHGKSDSGASGGGGMNEKSPPAYGQ